MINVVIPVVKNGKEYRSIVNSLIKMLDTAVLLGVTKSQRKYFEDFYGDNLYIFEYEDNVNPEEIINSMQPYVGGGSIFIMRKPITLEEYRSFTHQHCDVVLCEKKISGFKAFIIMLWKKILQLCLGLTLYSGDTSAIYFSEDISQILAQSSDLSFSTRVNRYKGIEQGIVRVSSEPIKTPIDKKVVFKYFLFAFLALIIPVVVTTVVSIYTKVNIIIGLLLVCLDIIGVFVTLLCVIMGCFHLNVGKKHFENATITNYKELFINEYSDAIYNKNDEYYDEADEEYDENSEENNMEER